MTTDEPRISIPIRNETDFYRAVVFMREQQKAYFRTRNKYYLQRSMVFEKHVDEYIEYNTPKVPDTQQQLFP